MKIVHKSLTCMFIILVEKEKQLLLVDMILVQYDDPQRQEAARKTVPVDKLEEKTAVALARVTASI